MAALMRVLVVEDDPEAVETWDRAIARHNSEEESHGFRIAAVYADSYEKAQDQIATQRIDAAVVDLRLKGPATYQNHNTDGNKVTAMLANTAVAAIAVYTGQPGEAENPTRHIETFIKDDGLPPVFDWLKRNSELARKMQEVISTISKDMASIFHGSIWPRWKLWMNEADQPELLSALTRHFVAHLHASLLDSTEGKAHPEEWYFVPPLPTASLNTGDLLKSEVEGVEIVITPRCDMVRIGKSTTIQLAKCESIEPQWKLASEKTRAQMLQHEKKNVQHFLPPMRLIDGQQHGPWYVRFDQIRSISDSEEVRTTLRSKRFATLTSEFLPSLVERLGNYFSRIGTPDVS